MKHDPDLRLCRYSPHTNRWVPVKQGVESLSKRELQVVKLNAQALDLGDIAKRLGISEKSASTYRLRAMEKLGVPNVKMLMLFALANGLAKNAYDKPDERIITMPGLTDGSERRRLSIRE